MSSNSNIRLLALYLFIFSGFLNPIISLAQDQNREVKLNPQKSLTQFPISSWNMDNGLPSDMIIGLTQDSTGFIWIATYKGISRFDGVNFTNYNHSTNSVIESVTIQAIVADFDGNLWFGSQRGVIKYKNSEFTRVEGLSLLDSVSVESLFFHPADSSLWIGTTGQGVYCFKDRKLEQMTGLIPFAKGIVKAIGSDKHGDIWIGTEGGRIIRYSDSKFQLIASTKPLGGVNNFYFCDENIFAATENGLFVFDKNRFANYLPTLNQRVNVVFKDNHNTLWMGTDNGVYRYHIDKKILENTNEDYGIPNNIIKTIMPDSEGNLWVGTYRKGLFKLSDGIVTNISQAEGLSSDIITAITQVDPNGYLIADEYGSMNLIINDEVKQLPQKLDLPLRRLKHLLTDSFGNIWVSTYGGLVKISLDGKQQVFNLNSGFPSEAIRLTFEDDNHNIWIGTRSNGAFKLSPKGEVKEFSLNNGELSSNYIMAINQDKKGRIVIASKNGLNILANDKLTRVIDSQNGLPSDFAFNVYIDSENIFWISSNDGIIRIENDSSIFVFNIHNGLFDNTLFDILEDDYGFFWIPSDIGIVRLSKQQLNNFAKGKTKGYSFKIYGKNDGMKNARCTGATKSLKSNDGRLFINTTGGVAIVDPKKLMDNSQISNIFIDRMLVDGVTLPYSHSYTIEPNISRVGIRFTAFYYNDPGNLRFRYKLHPFDKDWVNADGLRQALYTSLPPGKYTFTVQSSLRDDEWGDQESTINIRVQSAWWQTYWFQIGLALALAIILYLLLKYRTIAIRRQKLELERIVKQRTAQIEQQRAEIVNQSKELEKLSIVARHTINAVLIAAPNGDVQWVNESFTRIYGYTLDEFIEHKGRNLTKISPDPNICYIIQKCINEHVPTNYTLQVSTKTNELIWIQTNLTPIKNGKGEVRAIVAIDTDISELKQVEREMISLNDEIIVQTESIMKQNEAIQVQRDELEQVNNLLIRHTQNIEASIWYAHTIQKSILPSQKSIDKFFKSLIVFKPRDIVSGDFYWFNQLPTLDSKHERFLIALVDCTGHGVPGAFMSLIGSRLLSEIVTERKKHNPNEILVQLNRTVNLVLKQDSEDNIDAMDVALCLVEKVDDGSFKITFSGANRPLYILRKGANEVITIKGNRKTIGGIMPELDLEFENHKFTLGKGDRLIMCSDGYIDQNGMDNKKFTVARLHQLLLNNASTSMKKLGDLLDLEFDEHRDKKSQRDDATIIGIEL